MREPGQGPGFKNTLMVSALAHIGIALTHVVLLLLMWLLYQILMLVILLVLLMLLLLSELPIQMWPPLLPMLLMLLRLPNGVGGVVVADASSHHARTIVLFDNKKSY